MIIGVDAGAISITDERLKVGVWRVTYNLLKELSRFDTANQYRLYSFRAIDKGVMETFGPRMENVVLQPAKGWMSIRLPIELKLRPVNVFLGLAQALPSSSSRSIGFIYDLGFLFHPEAYRDSATKLTKQTANLVKHADHVITISESSKRDIMHVYRIKEDRVTVAYPGVEKLFTPRSPSRNQGLPGGWSACPYFLFVGSLNKAKDLPLAIEAFAQFLKQAKKPYNFLLIGGDYWPDTAIDASIHRCKLNKRVKKIGFVADEQLPGYYRRATAFVTTALHEGFCLPAAEAMACGTPVVAADRGAMKEVVGDGGIVVKGASAITIADALLAVASDAKMRRSLTKKALEQSNKYMWGRFAQKISTLINFQNWIPAQGPE